MSGIEKAIAIVGSQKALAEKIGVSQQAVGKWVASGEVPLKRLAAIERATDNKVTRYDLRPDFFGEAAASVAAG